VVAFTHDDNGTGEFLVDAVKVRPGTLGPTAVGIRYHIDTVITVGTLRFHWIAVGVFA